MHIWGIKIVSPSILPLSLSLIPYIFPSLLNRMTTDRMNTTVLLSTRTDNYAPNKEIIVLVFGVFWEKEREREKKGENHTVHLTLYKEDFRFSNHSMCCGSTRFASDCLSAKRSISPPLSIDTFFLKWMFTVRNNDM